MKAKALTRCEVEEEGRAQKPWREDKGLMEFLRNLYQEVPLATRQWA